MTKTLPIKPKKLNILRTRIRFCYYGVHEFTPVLARIYRPHLGDGLPKKAVWCRQGKNIFFRCANCSMINRNTAGTFRRKSRFAQAAKKKFGTNDVGTLLRCISCRWCRCSVSGTVLLGFKDPEAFLKKKVVSQ